MIRKFLSSLLPEYINQTLHPALRWVVEYWLEHDSNALAEAQAIGRLREAVRTQPVLEPSSNLFLSIQSRLETETGRSRPKVVIVWRAWATGMLLVVLSIIFLWTTVPPGITLQWSAQGGQPNTFRIYRAPFGADQPDEFVLIEEISAESDQGVYTYRDFLLLPGQEFVYRVEVIDQNGLSASQMIVSDAIQALPGQIALLLSFCTALYGLFLVVQKQGFSAMQWAK